MASNDQEHLIVTTCAAEQLVDPNIHPVTVSSLESQDMEVMVEVESDDLATKRVHVVEYQCEDMEVSQDGQNTITNEEDENDNSVLASETIGQESSSTDKEEQQLVFKCVPVSSDGKPDTAKTLKLNRDILKEVLEKHGFSMDPSDWPEEALELDSVEDDDKKARKQKKKAKKMKKKKERRDKGKLHFFS